MSNQYPPSGVLFTNNNKKTPNQPDYTGDLELSDEVINEVAWILATTSKKSLKCLKLP